jgi:hypothetical protein
VNSVARLGEDAGVQTKELAKRAPPRASRSIFGVDLFVSVAAEHPGAQILRHNQKHIGSGTRRLFLRGESREGEAAKQEFTAS